MRRIAGVLLGLASLLFLSIRVFFDVAPAWAQTPAPSSSSTSAGSGIGASFKYLGVNMHDLTNESPEKQDQFLSYLAKCNINTVRVFGHSEKNGGDGAGGIAQTADIAQRYGIKIIPALGDYANGSANIPGSIRSGPGSWYAGGYVGSGYQDYVTTVTSRLSGNPGILALELANEPHCNGFPDCFEPYVNWMTLFGQRIVGAGFKASTGMGTLDTVDDPTKGDYFNRISASAINMMSTHWYPETDPGKEGAMQLAAQQAAANGDEIILGEIGFACNASPCMQSTNDEERARQMLQKMGQFSGYGYDGFLYWQFSGFKNGNFTANDQYAWFAVGPDDVDNPFCKAFREGVVEPEDETKPLLLYPRNSVETSKYLANAQVYCAPPQVFQAVDPNTPPPLLPICRPAGDLAIEGPYADKIRELPVCNETQYPIVRGEESWNVSSMAFPLFRNQSGGISIELDLAKVTPGETILSALQRGGRANYAPQFYLSSPETQCLNAVRYIQYIQRLCSEWDPGGDVSKCGANLEITLQSGARRKLLDLASELGSESVCVNFSEQAGRSTELAQIVASIQPITPKVFKIGFLVHHTWLYDQGVSLLNQFLAEHLAAWFEGTEGASGFGNRRGERLTITPIWYHSGIGADEFDQLQTQPYTYDPVNLPTEPQSNPSNFAGPLWRTYSPLLPDFVHKNIAINKIEDVDRNYQFLRQILDNNFIGTQGYSLTYNGQIFAQQLQPITECTNQADCLCINSPGDPTCQNEKMEDLRLAFPDTFEPTDDYLADLKRQIVARINAGVQTSVAYPTNLTGKYTGTNPQAGPLSVRSFGQCKIDIENDNAFYGQSEQAQSIVSLALQSLNDLSEEPTPENLRKAITEVSARIAGKVLPINWFNRFFERRTTRAYIVLPDEAMDIDIAQAYITPMFMSPQMYDSIMRGENEIYPFNLDEQNEPKPEEDQRPLSAFLRTIGLSRSVQSDQAEGYVRTRRTQYAMECDDPVTGTGCRCTSTAISTGLEPEWVPYDPEFQAQDPQPPECVKREVDQDSVVDVRNSPDGTSPNANPQTPGQLQALNEFLRRAVFTPHYMQPYTLYPGLEMFYIGTGTSGLQPTEVGTFPVSGECVYREPREIVPSIKNNEQLTSFICSESGNNANISALTLAIWRIEGGRARNSIDLGGSTSYTCAPNRSGAIPPMNFVIGICSDGRIPRDFRLEMNTLNPDMCLVENSVRAGISKIAGDFSYVSRQNSSLSPSNPAQLKELFARASHLYIGTGYNCGDYRIDDDGTPLSGGGGLDYCGYAAVRAMNYLSSLPASCR